MHCQFKSGRFLIYEKPYKLTRTLVQFLFFIIKNGCFFSMSETMYVTALSLSLSNVSHSSLPAPPVDSTIGLPDTFISWSPSVPFVPKYRIGAGCPTGVISPKLSHVVPA